MRVLAPTAEYMLAMRVLASRSGMGTDHSDAKDIEFLIRLLGLSTSEQVMNIVRRYYDPSRILPRSHYLVDAILEGLETE